MKHSFLDKYSEGNSFIHRIDPRIKILITLIFILAVVITPPVRWEGFLFFVGFLLVFIAFSGVPWTYILKRSLVILPFILVVAVSVPFVHGKEVAGSYNVASWQLTITREGLLILAGVSVKAWLSASILIVLTATTRINDLLKALQIMRFPRILIMILSFMYRYIFVLYDEVLRMKQARDSRYTGGHILRNIRVAGSMIGVLFVRSYERGERVYAAMLSRGYQGVACVINDFKFKKSDFITGIVCFILLATVAVVTNIFRIW